MCLHRQPQSKGEDSICMEHFDSCMENSKKIEARTKCSEDTGVLFTGSSKRDGEGASVSCRDGAVQWTG